VEPYDLIPSGDRLVYPNSRQACDLWFGSPTEWAVEVKMARVVGDNGKPDAGASKDLLSPFREDRSALTDALKLAQAEIAPHKALLVYGFENSDRPLDVLINALEALLFHVVHFDSRVERSMGPLIHPHHADGRVFAWEIGKPLATYPDFVA
jgi:hypothetical protein